MLHDECIRLVERWDDLYILVENHNPVIIRGQLHQELMTSAGEGLKKRFSLAEESLNHLIGRHQLVEKLFAYLFGFWSPPQSQEQKDPTTNTATALTTA